MNNFKFGLVSGCLFVLSLAVADAQTGTTTISGTTTLDAGGFSNVPPDLGGCSHPTFTVVAPNAILVNQSCTCGVVTTQISASPSPFAVGSSGPLPGPLLLPQPVAYSGTIMSPCNTPASLPLSITSPSGLPPATLGLDYEYSVPLTAENGTPPYHWTVKGLPSGFDVVGDAIYAPTLLSLTGQSGLVQITVQDASGATASETVPFHLAQAPKELQTEVPDLSTVIKKLGQLFDAIEQDEPDYANLTDDYFLAVKASEILGSPPAFGEEGRVMAGLVRPIRGEMWAFLGGYIAARANRYSGQSARAVTIGANVVPVFDLGGVMINTGYNANTFFGTGTDPQSPPAFDFYVLAGAMVAIDGKPLTATDQTVPQEPVTTNPRMFVEFGGTLYTLDPPISYGYEYRMYAGAGFQSVQIPQSCASVAFPLVYQQADGSQASVVVQSGATYTFPTPVQDFKVTRMVPTAACTQFLTTVGFAGSDYEVLQETNIPVTFADVLTDITYAFQNGWINNLAVASTLYLEIQGAQKTTGCPQSLLLKVFTKEVSVESGKHINSQGVALLLNDASLLMGQLPAHACPAAN